MRNKIVNITLRSNPSYLHIWPHKIYYTLIIVINNEHKYIKIVFDSSTGPCLSPIKNYLIKFEKLLT